MPRFAINVKYTVKRTITFNSVFMASFHSDIRFRSFILVYRDNSLIVYSAAEAGNELWCGNPVDFMIVWQAGQE